MSRNPPPLFAPPRLPRTPAEFRFVRYLSLTWGLRVAVVVILLVLLHEAGLF
ncbi:MAG: hypothetical protein L3K04_00265 [Thermoplasmata archaeon]|nr:hypothetical protein [Thermoplasmata archaeon]MCI4337712.1 hypothetical protein [Thermoplasmata archaeon]MCI4341606.1 hypothetical protein [Thermoplasmata archaeon]